MTDQKYLKSLNKEELLRFGVLSLKSGNYITTRDIDKLDKKILTKESLQNYDKDILFEVCKQSNIESIEFLKTKAFDINMKDGDGNSCLHHAAKWGNTDLIEKAIQKRYFDANTVNIKNETPLHYQLKEGVYKYVKTAMIISKYTDLTIKDSENLEPHQIKLKNLQDSFRLEEFLRRLHNSTSNSSIK